MMMSDADASGQQQEGQDQSQGPAPERSFQVGDRVVAQRKLGTVRFFGPTDFKPGNWVGIELDEPTGKNNGTVQGRTYFQADENCGIFVPAKYVVPHQQDEIAAVMLQCNLRKMLAKRKVKARQAARTWNILDNHYEEVGLRKGRAVEKATKRLKAKTIVQENRTQISDAIGMEGVNENENNENDGDGDAAMDTSGAAGPAESTAGAADGAESLSSGSIDEEDEDGDDLFMGATVEELQQAAADAVDELLPEMLFAINVSPSYTGPKLNFPLRLEHILEMLDAFKLDKVLHFKYFMLLLLFGKRLLDEEKTVQDIDIPEGVKLTVVGDTHGQLQDLFTIFTINGVPSETNWYLFNGDFVDRGPKGCEIVATMLAFKILYPRCVFLNRGNHEARAQNAWMGFEEELLTKYGHDVEAVLMDPSTRLSRSLRRLKAPSNAPAGSNATESSDMETEENGDATASGAKSSNNSARRPKKKVRRNSLDRATGMREKMNMFGPGDRLASLKLYMLCQATFDALPLCALIQSRVFVCHGGLFRNEGVKLEHIREINRKREPPLEGTSFEDRIYEDLLWSDPRPTATYPRPLRYKRPSDRGAGCEFGPLVTNKFCATNQIALVVRSHECVPEGFEVLHNGRLITIFSASRYCGTQTNKGAFIAFGPDLQPEIQQFYAHAIQKGTFMSDEEREAMLERDAVKMIIENICDKRIDLYWYFTQNDTAHTGLVTRVEWAHGLQSVLNLEVPFLHYQSQLAELEPNAKMINYTKFLSRWQIGVRQEDSSWQDAIVRRICEKLYSIVGADLERAYRKFDINNDGRVSFDEFMRTLRSLNLGLSDQEIFEVMRIIDKDDSGAIDFNEFSSRFEVTFNELGDGDAADAGASGAAPLTAGSASGATGTGAAVVAAAAAETAAADVVAGTRGPGGTRLARTPSMFEIEQITEAAFPNQPSSPRKANKMKLDWINMDNWTKEHLKLIGQAIFQRTDSIRDAFKRFDTEDNGYFTIDQWADRLKSWLNLDLSRPDADKLFKAIDTNESGRLSAIEFVDAFHVRDRSSSAKSWQQGVVQQIANALYQNRIHLKSAFRMFDVDGNGTISVEEFQSGMETINELLDKPLSKTGIEELRRSLDRNGDGMIDYREFLAGLHLVDSSASQQLSRRASSYMDLNDPMFQPAATSAMASSGSNASSISSSSSSSSSSSAASSVVSTPESASANAQADTSMELDTD
ncbi:Serine/threonine-protein phosphatase [Hondaea fermentalgiana]|uniref:Serine/threonine-protein phosphatase n=1 Tax=Hondaea fermentalgiana TaxID=2315210 RepID=A0A2R5GPP4_9STRA|nr:Serine/threonine-protein phosphatase [Hondaea fermentalgiana]|eukprot:GBG31748.1 Serine/threonine-protein phosphatase [Hondaea fermentalgiana]